MKHYSEISNRYMKQNKKRTLLTVFGITMATILIFAVGTFLLSFRDSMIDSIRAEGDFEFKIQNLTSDEAEKIANNAEVKNSTISKAMGEFDIIGLDKGAELYAGDDDYYNYIYKDKILEGRKPAADNEIIIDNNRKNVLKVNVGDKYTFVDKNSNKKEYTIVGVSEETGYSKADYLDMYTYFDSSNLRKDQQYDVTVNLKSNKDKNNIMDNILEDAGINKDRINSHEEGEVALSGNSELLYLTGNGGNAYITESLNSMAIFVVAIIIVATITVIYNSFNISVIERMRYFGVLKAIGATPKQIKKIIFKEGFIMALLALPIGCLIGFFALKFGIKIFIGDSLMFMDNFRVRFYPVIILLTVVLVLITVYLSLIGPARKAKNTPAVDAMRNKNEIKLGKLKRRRKGIFGRVFGIEGNIAYKNIRRTPFRFVITIIALTLSIVIFNVFYGFIDFTKQIVNQNFISSPFDSYLEKSLMNSEFTDEEVSDIENKSFIKDYYKLNSIFGTYALPEERLTEEYKAEIEETELDSLGYKLINSNKILVCDDNMFNIIANNVTEGSIDLDKIKEGGVVIIDTTKTRDENGDMQIVRHTNYKIGDTLSIPKVSIKDLIDYSYNPTSDVIKEAIEKNEFYNIPVVAIADKEPIFNYYSDMITIAIHEDVFNKYINKTNPKTIFFKFNGDTKARSEAIEYFNSTDFQYCDFADELNEVDKLYNQIEFFVYCFIIIITVISVINIFNTISTNLLLRRKEFATLKAIGMTEKQLRKSVILEGTLYGVIAALVGGIISVILLKLLVNISGGMVDFQYKFNVVAFAGSIIAAILATYLSTILPLRKLRKLTIVEGISEEE